MLKYGFVDKRAMKANRCFEQYAMYMYIDGFYRERKLVLHNKSSFSHQIISKSDF